MKMNYLSPEINYVEVDSEGILCVSGDPQIEAIGENQGSWGF